MRGSEAFFRAIFLLHHEPTTSPMKNNYSQKYDFGSVPQNLMAELMLLSGFKSFTPEPVVKALHENQHIFRSFVWGRFDGYAELITLRDMKRGFDNYNADTLYILTEEKNVNDITKLLRDTCPPDELIVESEENTSKKLGSYNYPTSSVRLIRAWWD